VNGSGLDQRVNLLGPQRVVAREGDRPHGVGRPQLDVDEEIDGAAGGGAGHGLEPHGGLEVAAAAQEVDHQLALAFEHHVALLARRRQRPARSDGDAALDLVLLDPAVAAHEDVPHPLVRQQRHDHRHAAARGPGGDRGPVAHGVQGLRQARDGAQRLADLVAGARLDEGVAEGGHRLQQRL
jgi:hypothetical protein